MLSVVSETLCHDDHGGRFSEQSACSRFEPPSLCPGFVYFDSRFIPMVANRHLNISEPLGKKWQTSLRHV